MRESQHANSDERPLSRKGEGSGRPEYKAGRKSRAPRRLRASFEKKFMIADAELAAYPVFGRSMRSMGGHVELGAASYHATTAASDRPAVGARGVRVFRGPRIA